MLLKFIGVYNDKRYPLSGHGVTDITGAFISFYHEIDYTAIGAARQIQKWVLVPDGSPFNHYFESVEIHVDGRLIAKVQGEDLYRYSIWP